MTAELGFDACVDYRQAKDVKELAKLLGEAAPNGVDAHFENVGGDVLNAVMSRLNPFARVAMCGLITDYNNEPGEDPEERHPQSGDVLGRTLQDPGLLSYRTTSIFGRRGCPNSVPS